MAALNDDVKLFIVQANACYDTPSVVVDAVKAEFSLAVTRQQVELYDPTKRAGRKLAGSWKAIFEETRKAFLEDTAAIGISHKAVRLRTLQRMAAKAESMGNMALAAQFMEQAAKECGNAYTNRQVVAHTGPGGGPVQTDGSLRIEFVTAEKGGSNGG